MIRNIKAITFSSYFAMLVLGIGSGLVGAAARSIGLSAPQIGLMLALQNVGFGVAVWLAGAASDTLSKPKIMVAGSLILGLALLSFYVSPVFAINLMIMLFIGAGMGAYEGTTDALLFDLHEARAAFHINVNHFFVNVGAALITFYLIFLQANWRSAVVQSGIAVLGLALFFALVRLGVKEAKQASYGERMRILANSKLVALLFVVSILAVGVDVAALGIMTTFLMQLRGFSFVAAQLGLVIYLLGFAVGRVVMGIIAKDDRIPIFLITLLGLSAVSFTVVFFANLGAFTLAGAFLAGVCLSAVLPLILTYSGKVFRDMPGTVMGTIKVAFPIGGILVPLLMSLVASTVTFQASLAIFPICLLIAFLLLAWQSGRLRTALPNGADPKSATIDLAAATPSSPT